MSSENAAAPVGAPAVESTPSASTPAAPASEEYGSSEVNWSDMALGMDQDEEDNELVAVEGNVEVLGGTEPPGTPTTTPAAAPAPVPVVPSPAQAPAGEQVPPTQASPPAQPTAPAATPTPPSQEPPAQPQVQYAEWRGQQLEALEKHYAFSDDLAAKMLTEPETVIPKLAAQLHMEVTEQVMRSVFNAIPTWVGRVTSAATQESKAEEAFFAVNSDLKDPAYRPAILQMGQVYRSLNPNATPEEAIRIIGTMVRSAMGFAAPTPPGAAAVPSVIPTPFAAPPAPVTPFTPARGGGGGAVSAPASNNPWSQMAEEFLAE